MARQSTSISLINRQFDEWVKGRLEHLSKSEIYSTDPKMLLRNIDFRFMPFITYDEQRPVRVKIRTRPDAEPVKAILKLTGPLHMPSICVVSRAFGTTPVNISPGMEVLRYKPFRSKRWRSPKEYHSDQAAFYLLRYK